MLITFEPIPEWLDEKLSETVRKLLGTLGISPALDGRNYLCEAIIQTVRDPGRVAYITKELYPDIAKQYSTTVSNVERCMRTAVKNCWEHEGHEVLDKVAGYHLTRRPTNSEFIVLIAEFIRQRN